MSNGNVVTGVDVSHHNGEIDWAKLAGTGISFAFIKATDGSHGRDSMFKVNWPKAKATGLLIAAYHFLRPTSSPEAQGANFLDTLIDQPGAGQLRPVIDVEWSTLPGKPHDQWLDISLSQRIDWISRYVRHIEQAIGKKPIFYTNISWWDPMTHSASSGTGGVAFGDCPLWLADYKHPASPPLPAAWVGAPKFIWQYSEKGQVAGVSGNCDLDRFNGSVADLVAYAG